jgi:hypothetical protein
VMSPMDRGQKKGGEIETLPTIRGATAEVR